MQPAQMYDSAATMFSPDGRIYQVEYAREAVKRGTTAVGVTFDGGAVLLVDKRISSKLIEAAAVEKIFKIDRHIGCASSGLVGDARMLVARARAVAANNRVTYAESIEVNVLVKDLSDIMQAYTQNGGVRPFGAAFLIAGIDPDGTVRLFETDPSGAVVAYKASAIGVGRAAALEFLEQNWRAGDQEAAVALGLKALYKHADAGQPTVAGEPTVDVVVVSAKDGYRQLSTTDVKRALQTSQQG
ncbi:MAG TPA: archaeal proteasome endopeptidase complex subunit alpha [Candidatus Thermoplasmatota archaeon]|nr:archaeal proteasome endopeptidase complex subunit alpha [Candidatus Thermoplasmatota archaeon]